MIDNIELIKPLLKFNNEHDFYKIIILLRKKDQTAGNNEHQSVRTIKVYYITSLDHLVRKYDEIKGLCEFFQARAYIHPQCLNHKDISFDLMSTLAQRIKSGHINQSYLFDSVLGKIKGSEKIWIVDIDTKDESIIERIKSLIEIQRPYEKEKILTRIPTQNGVHFLTTPFDMAMFLKVYPKDLFPVEIHKQNPTCLYIPSNLK